MGLSGKKHNAQTVILEEMLMEMKTATISLGPNMSPVAHGTVTTDNHQ